MGKVKPDLAGAYVSKVGGVAYYIKDGVNYVRSLSKSGYKSNTPLQAGVKALSLIHISEPTRRS